MTLWVVTLELRADWWEGGCINIQLSLKSFRMQSLKIRCMNEHTCTKLLWVRAKTNSQHSGIMKIIPLLKSPGAFLQNGWLGHDFPEQYKHSLNSSMLFLPQFWKQHTFAITPLLAEHQRSGFHSIAKVICWAKKMKAIIRDHSNTNTLNIVFKEVWSGYKQIRTNSD